MSARYRQLFSHPFAGPLPWLMLATAFRIIHLTDPKAVISFQIAQISIFIAFLIAAQRLIEIAGGKTSLRSWHLGAQVGSGVRILGRLAVLVAAAGFCAAMLGDYSFAWEIFYGIDGIAFDGTGVRPKVISGLLAALILLMVLQVDRGEASSLVGAGREFFSRIKYLGPAIIAITVFLIAFSGLQGVVRRPMYAFWSEAPLNLYFRTLIYFAFVLGFASIRLWVVLAIVIFSLRQSYRAQNTITDV